MSEIKVGDLAWIRAKAGLKLSDDEVWFTDLVGTPIKNTDGEFIPDVPGLAALAAVVAEEDGLELALWAGADALDRAGDRSFDAAELYAQRDILRRVAGVLAAALEVK